MILHAGETLIRPQGQLTNVILVGLCGSGKTVVGTQLARRLGFGFLDLDEWIERAENSSIANIFSKNGENYFREKELEAFQSLKDIKNHVIALGGGAMQNKKINSELDSIGKSIYLDISISIIAKRLIKDSSGLKKRPLLADLLGVEEAGEREERLKARLIELSTARRNGFERARLNFSDAYASPDEAALRIKNVLEGKSFQKENNSFD